jgi:hypothetical protein
VAWLIMAVILTLQCGLPLCLRVLISALVLVAGGITLRRHVLLRGPRALRALRWPGEEGGCDVYLGPGFRRMTASLEDPRRYGPHLWLLRFRTTEGLVEAFVDTGRQDPHAVRRLAGCLFGLSRRSAGAVTAAGRRQADTIPPKV